MTMVNEKPHRTMELEVVDRRKVVTRAMMANENDQETATIAHRIGVIPVTTANEKNIAQQITAMEEEAPHGIVIPAVIRVVNNSNKRCRITTMMQETTAISLRRNSISRGIMSTAINARVHRLGQEDRRLTKTSFVRF